MSLTDESYLNVKSELLSMNLVKLNTTNSNWIHHRVMTGAYPSHNDLNKKQQILSTLYISGVNVIISLQEFDEDSSYTKYKDVYGNLAEYYQFPIKDRNTLPIDQLINIVKFIVNKLQDPNKIVYIHCQGGHGRTGLIATLLLKFTHNLTNEQSLDLWYTLHDTRINRNIRKTNKPGRLTNKQLNSLSEL